MFHPTVWAWLGVGGCIVMGYRSASQQEAYNVFFDPP